MGVSCNIIVTKPPEGVHRAGETVNGILEYAIDEPTIYKDVSVSFIGKGEFKLTKGTGDTSQNYYGSEVYTHRKINVLNKRPDETITLPFGSYRFPFEFRLPNDIPSSYSGNTKYVSNYSGDWKIKYFIKAVFEKPSLFSFNKTFEKNVVIYGIVNPIGPEGPIIAGIEKSISRINPLLLLTNSGRVEVVHLKGTISKSYLTPGEMVKINYEINNDSDIKINKIVAQLIQRTTLTTTTNVSNTLEKVVKGCTNESHYIPANTKTYIAVSLPTNPELYSIQHSKIINVEYIVRVTVDLPLPHRNASLEIPIAIGERHGHALLDIVELDDDDDFDLPTYKQAMGEDKLFYQV